MLYKTVRCHQIYLQLNFITINTQNQHQYHYLKHFLQRDQHSVDESCLWKFRLPRKSQHMPEAKSEGGHPPHQHNTKIYKTWNSILTKGQRDRHKGESKSLVTKVRLSQLNGQFAIYSILCIPCHLNEIHSIGFGCFDGFNRI